MKQVQESCLNSLGSEKAECQFLSLVRAEAVELEENVKTENGNLTEKFYLKKSGEII